MSTHISAKEQLKQKYLTPEILHIWNQSLCSSEINTISDKN